MARRQLSLNEKTWIVTHMCKDYGQRKKIRWLMTKFEQTGSVLDVASSDQPPSVTDQTTREEVSSLLEKVPHRHSPPSFSVQRVCKSLGYKAYVPGFDAIHCVIWTDEAVVKLHDYINRHNSVPWATETTNVTCHMEARITEAEGFTVWMGISSENVLRPYFVGNTGNTEQLFSSNIFIIC